MCKKTSQKMYKKIINKIQNADILFLRLIEANEVPIYSHIMVALTTFKQHYNL